MTPVKQEPNNDTTATPAKDEPNLHSSHDEDAKDKDQ
jgi:hypothetical protein